MVNNAIELNKQETRLYSKILSLKKLSFRLEPRAVILLQSWWRVCMKRKMGLERLCEIREFNRNLTQFNFEKVAIGVNRNIGLPHEIKETEKLIKKKVRRVQEFLKPMSEIQKKAYHMHLETHRINAILKSISNVCMAMSGEHDKIEPLIFYRSTLEQRSIVETSSTAKVNKIKLKKEKDRAVRKLLQIKSTKK